MIFPISNFKNLFCFCLIQFEKDDFEEFPGERMQVVTSNEGLSKQESLVVFSGVGIFALILILVFTSKKKKTFKSPSPSSNNKKHKGSDSQKTQKHENQIPLVQGVENIADQTIHTNEQAQFESYSVPRVNKIPVIESQTPQLNTYTENYTTKKENLMKFLENVKSEKVEDNLLETVNNKIEELIQLYESSCSNNLKGNLKQKSDAFYQQLASEMNQTCFLDQMFFLWKKNTSDNQVLFNEFRSALWLFCSSLIKEIRENTQQYPFVKVFSETDKAEQIYKKNLLIFYKNVFLNLKFLELLQKQGEDFVGFFLSEVFTLAGKKNFDVIKNFIQLMKTNSRKTIKAV